MIRDRSPRCRYVDVSSFGDIYTAKGFSEAVRLAALYASANNMRDVLIPPGEWTVGVPDANQQSGGDANGNGAAVILDAACSNVRFVGVRDRTILKPITNQVEMFSQNGATNIGFYQITFDNSANGVLELKGGGSNPIPGGGVTRLGNLANSAIFQWTGGGLTIDDCDFIEIYSNVYNGNYLDVSELVGDLRVTNSRFDGCVFGMLGRQPETLVFNDNSFINGINGLTSLGNPIPGHALYIANVSGESPYAVTANNNYGRDCASTLLRVRKGLSQVFVGNNGDRLGRGIESHSSHSLAIVGNSFSVYDVTPGVDNAQRGIGVTGALGGGVIVGNSVNLAGVDAWGIFFDDNNVVAEQARNILVANNTIIHDGSVAPTKAFIAIRDSHSLNIIGNRAVQLGVGVAHDQYVVDVERSTRIRAFGNTRSTSLASNPTGSDKLVYFGSGCSDCEGAFSASDLDVTPTTLTGRNLGTGGFMGRSDPVITGEWTDDVTLTFNTNGTFSPTITGGRVFWQRQGTYVRVWGDIEFDTNGYAGASGSFLINGLPFTPTGSQRVWKAALGGHENVVFTGTTLAAWATGGDDYLRLRDSATASAGAYLSTSAFPASTSDFSISFDVTYETDA